MPAKQVATPVKVKYVLYARKSTESEERQILSIDSQIKEMLLLGEREGLEIVAMKRESHSAKEAGQRPVFNEIVEEMKAGKYNGSPAVPLHEYNRQEVHIRRLEEYVERLKQLELKILELQSSKN